MKQKDVVIGGIYRARISGKLSSIVIETDRGYSTFRGRRNHNGWTAKNISTGRTVHIRSAARLTLPMPKAVSQLTPVPEPEAVQVPEPVTAPVQEHEPVVFYADTPDDMRNEVLTYLLHYANALFKIADKYENKYLSSSIKDQAVGIFDAYKSIGDAVIKPRT